MSTTPNTPTDASTPPAEVTPPAGDPKPQGPSFTQADLDRIVQDRVARERAKFADYDDLKSKAGESQTLEQRVADMEARTKAAEASALRASVAAEFGISTKKGPKGEPSDADLFLTGADESTLTAQAQRLAAREEDRKKQGNFAPKEGNSPSTSGDANDLRDFTKKLFNKE